MRQCCLDIHTMVRMDQGGRVDSKFRKDFMLDGLDGREADHRIGRTQLTNQMGKGGIGG